MAYLPSAEHRLRSKDRPENNESKVPNRIYFEPNKLFNGVEGVQDLAKMPERVKTPLTKNLQDLDAVFNHLLNEHKKPAHTATSKTKNRI